MEGDPEGDEEHEREDLVLEDQLARWGMGIGRKHLYLHPILDTRISVRQVRASKMRGGGSRPLLDNFPEGSLKKTIESVSMLIPPLDPPSPTVSALG